MELVFADRIPWDRCGIRIRHSRCQWETVQCDDTDGAVGESRLDSVFLCFRRRRFWRSSSSLSANRRRACWAPPPPCRPWARRPRSVQGSGQVSTPRPRSVQGSGQVSAPIAKVISVHVNPGQRECSDLCSQAKVRQFSQGEVRSLEQTRLVRYIFVDFS